MLSIKHEKKLYFNINKNNKKKLLHEINQSIHTQERKWHSLDALKMKKLQDLSKFAGKWLKI